MSKQINIEDYISMYINEKIDILKNYPITQVQEAVEVIFSAVTAIRTLFRPSSEDLFPEPPMIRFSF